MSIEGEVASSRARLTKVVTGAVAAALVAWFVAPQVLDWSGPWVPSAVEVAGLLPVLLALVWGIGSAVRGRFRVLLLVPAVAIAAAVAVGVVLIAQYEAKPGDEGVLPGPVGVRVVEGAGYCGSHSCSRDLEATGDRAADVMRAHLASRGYTPKASLDDSERMCRRTGLVVTHEACAELHKATPSSVEVVWYVN
ncbi:hypothetical protein [Lentzea sp. NPDC059081]|uniref:hypothetical protein n=1 Tax=Lentzea sp. NPDC059081 TaxID=3346719 RepID=UPI0036A0CA82